MKWEALLAMVGLMLLGLWLVWGPGDHPGIVGLAPDARAMEMRLGNTRGVLEVQELADGGHQFRMLYRDGSATEPLDAEAFRRTFGEDAYQAAITGSENPFFRLLNITNWWSVIWVAVGFGGQIAFFGRMFVQWMVSEKQKKSVVPEIFWWLSLVGGIALFTYFAWRRDIVGVLGQTSGVVIYARNLRLIHKRRRRAERQRARAATARAAAAERKPDPAADPAPEPVDALTR